MTKLQSLVPVEVATRIYQIRLPLPFALNHVNCYLLRETSGWTMLDTGLNWLPARLAWQQAFAALEITPNQIQRIVLTHMHPDHFGLAGYFQELTGAPVLLSVVDAQAAQRIWVENGWRKAKTSDFWQRAGIDQALIHQIATQVQHLRRKTMPHPPQIELMAPGTQLHMAGRNWRAIHAPGHSDGQLIFYAAAEQLMLCGDQILGKITPNIGCWPGGEVHPLPRYLHSLATLETLPVRLALPGHGAPITTWRDRIIHLQAHHQARLAAMYAAAAEGTTALRVAQALFNFAKFSEHEVRFAVAETLAHLEYLVDLGELQEEERDGVYWYGKRTTD